MEKLTLCRICLAKNIRMCDVVNTNLQETYESLTAMQFETKDSRPSQVCYICYAQLQTCHKLRYKSLQSEELFRQVLDGCELKLASLHNVTPPLTIQTVSHLSIVPVSFDTIDTDVKDEKHDDPSWDCSSIIDNVEVKEEHVEGTEDVFDAGEDRIEYGTDENLCETEDCILPLSTIDNSERRTPVASRYNVCPKTVKVVLRRLELTNVITSVPAPTELRITEQENKTANGEEVVNDSSQVNVNKTGCLLSHIHTDISDGQYKCDICGKWFKIRKNLLRHARLHTDIKAYCCDICGKYFTTNVYLVKHIIRIHPDIKPYVCNICGEGFFRKITLSNHILTHPIRSYACDICGKSFTNSVNFSSHIRTHTTLKSYTCDICGKSIKSKHGLSRHIRTHTGIKPYACDICGKDFKRKDCLSSHLHIHSGTRAYVCNICGKDFKRKTNLWSHTRIKHTGIKPYTCDICGKDFIKKDQLSLHIFTHTGIRAYGCDICGKGFTSSRYLKKHTLIHTIKRAHTCDICGKSFKGINDLPEHICTHTGIKPRDICAKD